MDAIMTLPLWQPNPNRPRNSNEPFPCGFSSYETRSENADRLELMTASSTGADYFPRYAIAAAEANVRRPGRCSELRGDLINDSPSTTRHVCGFCSVYQLGPRNSHPTQRLRDSSKRSEICIVYNKGHKTDSAGSMLGRKLSRGESHPRVRVKIYASPDSEKLCQGPKTHCCL